MGGVLVEHIVSITWAYAMAATVALCLLGKIVTLPEPLRINTILQEWYGVLLGITCLLQFAVSLAIDGRYEQRMGGADSHVVRFLAGGRIELEPQPAQ
jgi:biofilm PGA synthesis N-glycosyltransferase PgaC